MIENASNQMSAGDIIREVERIEREIELLSSRKSTQYKLANVFGLDVTAIRQVLHVRREAMKNGGGRSPVNITSAFEAYMKEASEK